MCSPPRPSTPKINPYAGMTSDPRFAAGAKALGFNNVDSESEVQQINQYLMGQDIMYAQRDPNYAIAQQQLLSEGRLKATDAQDSRYLSEVQSRMYEITQDEAYAEQKAETDKAAQDFKDMMDKQAADQAKMMDDLLNGPKYSAQQAALPPVMAPVVTPEPIPVAPPTPPMEIQRTPPPPELTSSPQNMAIVRQSKTARSRQRMRSRGTASLT